MNWYGSNTHFKKISNVCTNNSQKHWLKKRKNSKNLTHRSLYNSCLFFLYVPSLWNTSFFTNKKKKSSFIFFYSPIYFFFLPIKSSFFLFNFFNNSNVISIFFFYKNIFHFTFFSYFKKIFHIFSKIFFKKLKFKGKGYYIYKNTRNTIAFRFGYSHIRRRFFFYNFVKFLSKTSVIIFGLSLWNISKASFDMKSIKPINIFTGKGIRLTRQIIYRKTGKVSSYR